MGITCCRHSLTAGSIEHGGKAHHVVNNPIQFRNNLQLLALPGID